ncbi:MAG: peptide chain release factor N(5)-glutamine methyltransferase [Candidatus Rokubacteria bacterium]|nr:peptide chain release factor N(5)-glutamine methyltransferase [Candidatus Rokubacteria bacterium]
MTTATSGLAVGVLLREGTRRLEDAAIATARQDAEWLLATVLGLPRFDLYLEPAREVTAGGRDRFWALIGRRQAHEPLQYLLGFEDFVGLRIRVTPDVLIPRPETEGLVEWAVEILAPLDGPVAADVGTGSGAIACALAAACPALEVLAIDSSPAALGVAAGNVCAAGLSARVRLVAGDLLAPLASLAGGLDMIVSNPPYLPTGIIPSLPREVAGFEPRLALDGGPDGLRVIRRIVAEAPGLLRSGGTLLMEIGEEQAGLVASLMAAEGFSRIAARRDLRGVERFIAGQVGG